MTFAFVFPGQGSQTVGMIQPFINERVVTDAIAEGSEALQEDLLKLMQEGPAEALNLTTNTQPAMLVASVAFYRAYLAAGGQEPQVVAGHSLGEYAALVAAQVLGLADAVRLVRHRAEAMQHAVPVGVGAMAAILGLSDDDVRQACASAAGDEVVEPVNFNAPAQVVIAGHRDAVERACEAARQAGAKRAVSLPVSAPFHSSLMKPAADRLAEYLGHVTFAQPRIDVINNVDVSSPHKPDAIKDALVRQAWQPVRWVEVIKAIEAREVKQIVECGPGKVLTAMNKRIALNLVCANIFDPNSMSQTLALLA